MVGAMDWMLLFDLVEGSLSVQLKRPKMDVKITLEAAGLGLCWKLEQDNKMIIKQMLVSDQ